MFCRNCGNEMPDGSKFCTSCGCKLDNENGQPMVGQPNFQNNMQQPMNNMQSNNQFVKLIVSRRKRMLGCAISMKILIDGNEVAKLRNGDMCELDLPAGQHRMLIDTVGEVTDQMLDLSPGCRRVYVDLAMGMGLVSGKAKIESIRQE